MLQSLAEQQKWKPGTWAFDGRKNIYSPRQFLPKEERSYRVRCSLSPRKSEYQHIPSPH